MTDTEHPTRARSLYAILMTCCLLFIAGVVPSSAAAADRDRIKAFLEVTGFDVALDSIAFAAGSAPDMLGFEARDFGSEWDRLSGDVFDTAVMRGLALDILEHTLSDELLNHAAAFYASDLGQRLVVAENASHMVEDETGKQAEGQTIIADLMAEDDGRIEMIQRMNAAIDSSGNSARALQEIQIRFLLAASAAGVIELRLDPDELREMFAARQAEMESQIRLSAMAGAAYTYRDFSNADLMAYVEALEDPKMQSVYELLNAVQFEIMANRFEVLATRMADLQPSQDL